MYAQGPATKNTGVTGVLSGVRQKQKNMPYWPILLNGAKYKVILQIWLGPETE